MSHKPRIPRRRRPKATPPQEFGQVYVSPGVRRAIPKDSAPRGTWKVADFETSDEEARDGDGGEEPGPIGA